MVNGSGLPCDDNGIPEDRSDSLCKKKYLEETGKAFCTLFSTPKSVVRVQKRAKNDFLSGKPLSVRGEVISSKKTLDNSSAI